MKQIKHTFFTLYQFLIAFPILLVITILVALTTTILSPILPNSKLSYYPARFWGRTICRLCFVTVKISGLENLEPLQSYVVVCNHQSMFDIFVVYGWFPFIFKWMMKAELRRIPLVGKACEAAGHILSIVPTPLKRNIVSKKPKPNFKTVFRSLFFPKEPVHTPAKWETSNVELFA